MTKKHYKAIARIIKRNYEISTEPARFRLRDIVSEFCQFFETDNPLFNRSEFVEACGINATQPANRTT